MSNILPETKPMNQDKLFHIWQIGAQPKYSKTWNYISHMEEVINAVNAYNEKAPNAKEQIKRLVALVDKFHEQAVTVLKYA
jgi:hypothetical protein